MAKMGRPMAGLVLSGDERATLSSRYIREHAVASDASPGSPGERRAAGAAAARGAPGLRFIDLVTRLTW